MDRSPLHPVDFHGTRIVDLVERRVRRDGTWDELVVNPAAGLAENLNASLVTGIGVVCGEPRVTAVSQTRGIEDRRDAVRGKLPVAEVTERGIARRGAPGDFQAVEPEHA